MPKRVFFAILGALIVPVFGRVALHGTGAESDLYRYIVPLFVGGTSGFLIGLALDNSKKTKTKFQEMVEITSDFIWEVDSNGVYTYVSPKIKEILGYTPGEAIGKSPFDFMPEDEAVRVSKKFHEIIESGEPFAGLENVNHLKDGKRVVLETSGVPLFDSEGRLYGYRGVDRDISKRKEIEKELRNTVHELKQALVKVQTLSGLLPICAKCKKIRDDRGYWNSLESYIEKHSDASFSHGVCRECSDELYGDEDWYIRMKKKK